MKIVRWYEDIVILMLAERAGERDVQATAAMRQDLEMRGLDHAAVLTQASDGSHVHGFAVRVCSYPDGPDAHDVLRMTLDVALCAGCEAVGFLSPENRDGERMAFMLDEQAMLDVVHEDAPPRGEFTGSFSPVPFSERRFWDAYTLDLLDSDRAYVNRSPKC